MLILSLSRDIGGPTAANINTLILYIFIKIYARIATCIV